MRFLDLVVRHDHSEHLLRFHRGVTVLGPLDANGRSQWAEALIRTLKGDLRADAVLDFLDGMGDQIRLERAADGSGRLVDPVTGDELTTDDTGALDLLDALGLDLPTVRNLAYVLPGDIAAVTPDATGPVPTAELGETRELLDRVESEYDAAMLLQGALDALEDEALHLEGAIRASADLAVAKRWAEAVAVADALRSELDLARGVDAVDPAATAAAARALVAGERHQVARDRADEARAIFGSRRRLTPDALAHALAMPADVPVQLAELHDDYLSARVARDQLRQQLTDSAASTLPEPSQPFVLALARAPQSELWERAERALESERTIAQLSVTLGGAGSHQELVGELERAHEAVDLAERHLHGVGRRPVLVGLVAGVGAAGAAAAAPMAAVPLVAAGLWAELRMLRNRTAMRRAERQEASVLERAGFTSWLGFKLRWVETLIDVNARETLQIAELQHNLNAAAWHELAGPVTPAAALAVRAEVEQYSAHIETLRGSSDAADAARRSLLEDVEPTYERALGALQEIAAPFGVDPEHAVSEVAALVFEARSARLQLELEVTEAEESQTLASLVEALAPMGVEVGVDPGQLDAYLVELAAWTRRQDVVAGQSRDGVPSRDPAEIDAELTVADTEVARLYRPGFELLDLDGDVLSWDPLESTCRHASLSIL